eukprot:3327584-Pleurochrysis_carterae.AAC.1
MVHIRVDMVGTATVHYETNVFRGVGHTTSVSRVVAGVARGEQRAGTRRRTALVEAIAVGTIGGA